jgi:hypothetical protein
LSGPIPSPRTLTTSGSYPASRRAS